MIFHTLMNHGVKIKGYEISYHSNYGAKIKSHDFYTLLNHGVKI